MGEQYIKPTFDFFGPVSAQGCSQQQSEEFEFDMGHRIEKLCLQLKLREADMKSLKATVDDLEPRAAKLDVIELQLRSQADDLLERIETFRKEQTQRRDGRFDPQKEAPEQALVTISDLRSCPEHFQSSDAGLSLASIPQPLLAKRCGPLLVSLASRLNLKRAAGSESGPNPPTSSQFPRKRARPSSDNKISSESLSIQPVESKKYTAQDTMKSVKELLDVPFGAEPSGSLRLSVGVRDMLSNLSPSAQLLPISQQKTRNVLKAIQAYRKITMESPKQSLVEKSSAFEHDQYSKDAFGTIASGDNTSPTTPQRKRP
ncbi:MAG: hypothetical protein Q9199_006868 [Rusavskia elegans]